MRDAKINVIALDALDIAEECGTSKAVNIVLIGVLSTITKHIEKEIWMNALKSVIPQKLYKINEMAFLKGYEYGESVK